MDAVIGMIPLVGDVTAARDIIAVTIRLVDDPKKREDKLEWMTLGLLLFALIPVLGGVIKGAGKLLLKVGAEVGDHARVLREMVQVLNRVGRGDAVKFLKDLDLETYVPELRGQWKALTQRFDDVCAVVLEEVGGWLTPGMKSRVVAIQQQVRILRDLGDRLIPDGIKELNRRLKTVQRQVYEGEWHDIPASLVSKTREVEARLVEEVTEKGIEKTWMVDHAHHPPSDPARDYAAVADWPDLGDERFMDKHKKVYEKIRSFSGPIRAVRLAPGTKVYRVVTASSAKPGLYWAYRLPKDGRAWREECAVLESWSQNGYFVELIVPESGLLAWEGTIASQIESNAAKPTFGQYLKGGETQLLIDFRHAANEGAVAAIGDRIPTHWTDHMNVNVPDRTISVQTLGQQEVAPKRLERAGKAAVTGQRLRSGMDGQEAEGNAL